MSTAVCERGFSALKRIKSDWRSMEMLDSLMAVVLEGPTLQYYNPAGAMDKWWKQGQRTRRPDFGENMAAAEADLAVSESELEFKTAVSVSVIMEDNDSESDTFDVQL